MATDISDILYLLAKPFPICLQNHSLSACKTIPYLLAIKPVCLHDRSLSVCNPPCLQTKPLPIRHAYFLWSMDIRIYDQRQRRTSFSSAQPLALKCSPSARAQITHRAVAACRFSACMSACVRIYMAGRPPLAARPSTPPAGHPPTSGCRQPIHFAMMSLCTVMEHRSI